MSDKTDIVLSMLKEIKDDAKDWRGKTDSRLSAIETVSTTQTQQLQEHMRRTEIAESRLDKVDKTIVDTAAVSKEVDKRVSKLEQPLSVKKVASWITGAGAVAAAIYAIIRLMEL